MAKKKKLSGKQRRYLFAKGILRKSGKGKNAKVVYKKGGKKKSSFLERAKKKKANMSHTDKRKAAKRKASNNYMNKLSKMSNSQLKAEYDKRVQRSLNASKNSKGKSNYIHRRVDRVQSEMRSRRI